MHGRPPLARGRCSTAATSDAQAPVPHAMVSPEPRSQTRIAAGRGASTRTNSVFTRRGKNGWCSKRGPMRLERRASSTSSTKTTQCGLPIETQVTARCAPSTSSGWSRTSPSASTGMRAAVEHRHAHVDGDAASTRPPRRAASSSVFTPASVSTRERVRRAQAAVVDVLGDAADAVAAHLAAAAVGVVHLHAAVGVGRTGGSGSGRRRRCRGGGREPRARRAAGSGDVALAAVDVDVVVADAVHLGHADDASRHRLSRSVVRERSRRAIRSVASSRARGSTSKRSPSTRTSPARPRVVVRRHREAVGAGAHHRQQLAALDRRQLAVLREEVAALADRPDDVDAACAARRRGAAPAAISW